MAGEWLTATANTNMFTYEIAPVFILMETVVMRKMREIIGPGWENGDSILAPGQTFFFKKQRIVKKRFPKNLKIKHRGLDIQPLRISSRQAQNVSLLQRKRFIGYSRAIGYVHVQSVPLFYQKLRFGLRFRYGSLRRSTIRRKVRIYYHVFLLTTPKNRTSFQNFLLSQGTNGSVRTGETDTREKGFGPHTVFCQRNSWHHRLGSFRPN